MKQLIEVHENGRALYLDLDIEGMLDNARSLLECDVVNDEKYVQIGSDNTVTQEQWNEDINRLISDIEKLRDHNELVNIVENIDRKKDGYFAKGRVYTIDRFQYTGQYWEDSYGWNHCTLRAKSINGTTAEVRIHWDMYKW